MAEHASPNGPPRLSTRHLLSPLVPLLVGVGLLTGANGLQGSLVALRGAAEGFRGIEIGVIASAYFTGFLIGAQLGAAWIKRVGHVRAFAAFASIASTMVLIHVLAISVPVWIVARLASGVCVAGLLVIIESWLNRSAPSEARGRVLSVYMVVNVGTYAAAQLLLTAAPVESFELFAVVSVLLSAALLPVILSRRSTAEVVDVHPLPVRRLFERAPAGTVASAMAGLTWGAIAGWSPVVASLLGLRGLPLTAFIGSFLIGHLLMEPVVGVVSDRLDRRLVVTVISAIGTAVALIAMLVGDNATALTLLGFGIGGAMLPLYSLSIALAGDHLAPEEMVAASGTLVRINGVGAAVGPLLVSVTTGVMSIPGYYLVLAIGTAVTMAVGAILLLRAGYRPPRVPYIGMVARGSTTSSRESLARAASVVRGRRVGPMRSRQRGDAVTRRD